MNTDDWTGWHHVVVALGSNQGDREDTLFRALADIRATEGLVVTGMSRVHETVALTESGYDEQAPGYLNQVVVLMCAWPPEQLLTQLQAIEAQHGRTRTSTRYADRTLDIDIISFDDLVVSSDSLTLPHPRAHERSFVLGPWLEADPSASLPGHGPVAKLLKGLEQDN